MKCKPKLVPLAAIQWTGANADEIYSFLAEVKPSPPAMVTETHVLLIPAHDNSLLKIYPYWYLLRDNENLYWCCDELTFEKTYEIVNEEEITNDN